MFESLNEMMTFITIVFLPLALIFYIFRSNITIRRDKNILYKVLIGYTDNEDE